MLLARHIAVYTTRELRDLRDSLPFSIRGSLSNKDFCRYENFSCYLNTKPSRITIFLVPFRELPLCLDGGIVYGSQDPWNRYVAIWRLRIGK